MPFARPFAIFGALFLVWPAMHSKIPAAQPATDVQNAALSPAANEVARARDQWAKYLNAKQLGPLMALYSPEAALLQPSGERVNGAPSIRALTAKLWQSISPDISLHGVTTKVSCDLAYDSGDFHETVTSVSGGAKQQLHGQYLMVFKRGSHGGWLIVEQVWTGTEPKHD